HPSSSVYAGFADFHLYRIEVERGHMVAGFGRIDWIAPELICRAYNPADLAAAGETVLAHMNADHADAVVLYAQRLAGRVRAGWQMTGMHPDGFDLRAGDSSARIDFPDLVLDADGARRALIALLAVARGQPA